MAIIKTHLYSISFDRDDLMKILIDLDSNKETIFPQDSKKIVSNVKGVSVMDQVNPYNESLDALYQILDRLDISKEVTNKEYKEIDLTEVEELLATINNKIDEIVNIKQSIISEQEENKEAINVLQNITKAQVSLDDIGNTNYITIRLGKVPIADYNKLKYYKDYQFIWRKLTETKHYVWLVYTGLTKNIGEIDNILYSMNFEPTKIPDFAHGGVVAAIAELEEEVHAMDTYIEEANMKLEEVKKEYFDEILRTFNQVYNLKKLFDQCRYVVDYSHKAAIYSFSTLTQSEVENALKEVANLKVMELPENIYSQQGINPPVIIKNNKFFEPFQNVLTGHPGDTFDPTIIIAIVSLVAAAILIGDVAIGVILGILGLLLSLKKESVLSGLLQRFGVAILIGGLLTGKYFYINEIFGSILDLGMQVPLRFILCVAIIVVIIVVLMIIKKLTRKQMKL